MNKKIKPISALLFYIPFVLLASPFSSDSLAEQKQWLKLGHYQSGVLSNWKSDVDDESFFLSKNGKRDPKAELLATIDAFNGQNLSAKETQEIICRFPARFIWLKNKIDNHWGDLICPELEAWQSAIDPDGMTLIFPTGFMGNPASMFGHTLLRIDSKALSGGHALTSYAVNFAAEVNPSDTSATFALKGLTGLYDGHFSMMPYYEKVNEYSDIESRDIWEYKLNFNPEEVDFILLHLWELRTVHFDYYFVDENCSYQLLSLLQIARDELDFTSQFSMHVIPSDTVRVLKSDNLLQEANYRPSVGTLLFNYSEQLSDVDLSVARLLVDGDWFEQSERSDAENAAILEMAYEWLNFEFYNKNLEREIVAPRLTKLLINRSKIKLTSPFLGFKQSVISPELGHSSSRVGISVSHASHSNVERSTFSYRLAYHDLLDKSDGFMSGAQINVFDLDVSTNEKKSMQLDKLYVLDLIALPAHNRLFDSWSWGVRAGFDRQADTSKQSGHWFTQAGYGKSVGDANHLQAYLLGSLELNGGDITDNNLKLGMGTEFGAIWQVTGNNKVAVSSKIMHLINSDVDYHLQTDLTWNTALAENWALRSNLSHQKWRDENNIIKLTLFHYF
jgi:hypothetical protein